MRPTVCAGRRGIAEPAAFWSERGRASTRVSPSTVSNRRSQEPANCGPLASFSEIFRFERLCGGAQRIRTISQDIMPDRAAGDDAPAAVEIPSFTHLSVPRTQST